MAVLALLALDIKLRNTGGPRLDAGQPTAKFTTPETYRPPLTSPSGTNRARANGRRPAWWTGAASDRRRGPARVIAAPQPSSPTATTGWSAFGHTPASR